MTNIVTLKHLLYFGKENTNQSTNGTQENGIL